MGQDAREMQPTHGIRNVVCTGEQKKLASKNSDKGYREMEQKKRNRQEALLKAH